METPIAWSNRVGKRERERERDNEEGVGKGSGDRREIKQDRACVCLIVRAWSCCSTGMICGS